MKAAFTTWNGRIAPLFDVAERVLVVETGMSENPNEWTIELSPETPEAKVTFLMKHNAEVLVCGAISRQVREMAEEQGLKVYPFVAGEIREIVAAWKNNTLDQYHYSMPGCRRGRRQLRQRSGRNNR
jgi:predicted Fe-Mo cluster-binding NifX family protein